MSNETKQHQGRNIKFFRESKRMKQGAFAQMLNVTQSAVAKMEQKDEIDEDVLARCAIILGVSMETLKDFDVEKALQSISGNTFNIEKLDNFMFGENEIGTFHFNPIEKIVELYDKMILTKDEQIRILTEALNKCSKKG